MIHGTLMLVGRETGESDRTIETHAERLRQRNVAETVVTERFDRSAGDRSTDWDAELDDGDVYVVPMTVASTNETEQVLPSIADGVAGSAVLCDPVGRSPAVTDVLADRATDGPEPSADASLVLVGLGSSYLPHQRRVVEYHRRRLAARTVYDEVTTAYLLQDPAVECARYNVTNDDIVAVPVFVTPSEATTEEIPDRLGDDGITYTDPLGSHPRLTDAIQAEVTKRHVLESQDAGSRSAAAVDLSQSVATDGRGPSD